jgi:hypothetical protein
MFRIIQRISLTNSEYPFRVAESCAPSMIRA